VGLDPGGSSPTSHHALAPNHCEEQNDVVVVVNDPSSTCSTVPQAALTSPRLLEALITFSDLSGLPNVLKDGSERP
jgi:hypothetical protein